MPPRLFLLSAALLFWAPIAIAQLSEETLAERVVAVVDDDPILASDLERAIALGLTTRIDDEDAAAFQQRTLDRLIEEKLRFHEIDRYGFEELPLEEVNRRFADIRGRFSSEAEFERRMDELGLTRDQVRELLARQVLVLVFVEERLGPRVFVSRGSILEYYEQDFVAEMRRLGQPVPELGAVREQIRKVLRELRLNEELDLWTEELRRQADIADYLEARPEALPPILERR